MRAFSRTPRQRGFTLVEAIVVIVITGIIAAGVAVRIASRCGEGCISPITDQAWKDAGGLSPVKARIRLMLELMQP